MSERITTRWDKVEVLRTARRRRALAELDYRRAVIDVVESGLEVSEVAQRLGVAEATLEGVWNLCEGITEAADGFSGSSPAEIVQRYEVGMLSPEQVVEELAAWDYDGMLEAEAYPPAGHGGAQASDAEGGDSARPDDPGWARWLSQGAWEQLAPQPAGDAGEVGEQGDVATHWVPDPQGMSVNPDGEWAQVEDAFQAGLLPAELYVQVLEAVNPAVYAAMEVGERDGAYAVDGVAGDEES